MFSVTHSFLFGIGAKLSAPISNRKGVGSVVNRKMDMGKYKWSNIKQKLPLAIFISIFSTCGCLCVYVCYYVPSSESTAEWEQLMAFALKKLKIVGERLIFLKGRSYTNTGYIVRA